MQVRASTMDKGTIIKPRETDKASTIAAESGLQEPVGPMDRHSSSI